MKICSRCQIPKDSFKDFSPSKRYKDGRASRCKKCQSEIMSALRAANPEKTKEDRRRHNKSWRASPIGIAYLEENKEKMSAYHKQWAIENAEEIAIKAAIYYQEHKEECNARTTAWRIANPKKWTAIHKRWEANKKGASINDFTHEQWLEILDIFDHRCAYCSKNCRECRNKTHELTQDHVWPLSKGGPHTASNIVPACRSCNAKKNAGDVPVPVQPVLLTLAPPKH